MNRGTYKYQFVGGNLALDFVNTVAYRFDPEKKEERLQSAEDLRRWANQARLPDRDAINSCIPLSGPALSRVHAVREQLFRIFQAIANHEPISPDILRQIGHALRDCRAKQCLSVRRGEVRWTWGPGADHWEFLMYPILAAATDLLTSDSCRLIRHCADEGCGWLFLDRSNARKRRWCRMADCGNRNKVRDHYRRKAALL